MESFLPDCREARPDCRETRPDNLLTYILRKLQSFPDTSFSGTELIKISKLSFETLKKNKYLQSVKYSELYYDEQGNERFIQQINGKYFAYSTEDSSINRIPLTKEDITFWSFNIPTFLKALNSKNKLSGKVDLSISSRIFFIGEKNKTAIFLGLLPDEKQAELELLSLNSKISNFNALLVLCPSFTVSSQALLKQLESQSISCIPFNTAFPNNDFLLDPQIFETIYPAIQKPSTKKSIAKFPTPPGTKWDNITIVFLDKARVRIIISDIKSPIYTFLDMGFQNKTTGAPNLQWQDLCEIARKNGIFDMGTPTKAVTFVTLRKRKEAIANRLKAFFSLTDDPFCNYKIDNKAGSENAKGKKREHFQKWCWRTRFTILLKEEKKIENPNFSIPDEDNPEIDDSNI